MSETKRYLSIEEAAELLGVEYKTVYRLIRSGELPAGRIGRVYRLLQSDIEGYFEGQKQILSGGQREFGRCGVCGNAIVSELSVAGHCSVCGADICPVCWTVKKHRACSVHGGSEVVAASGQKARGKAVTISGDVVASLREAGKAVITAEESAVAEATFIREFLDRVGGIQWVLDPIGGVPVVPADARVNYDEKPADAGKVGQFVFRTGGWGKPKAAVAVEGRYFARVDVLRNKGYDSEPIGKTELEKLVNGLADEQEGRPVRGAFRMVQIGSPTGFDEAAVAWVSRGKACGNGFTVVLVDLHSGAYTFDESDERLVGFYPVANPAGWSKRIVAARDAIAEILVGQKSLTLDNAVSRLGEDESVVRRAFAELSGEGYMLDELKDLGLVVSAK